MAVFDLKLFRLHRVSNGKTEGYSIVTQKQGGMETPFLLEDEDESELNGKCQFFLDFLPLFGLIGFLLGNLR